ncbi:hypothetical protein [Aliiglaciecola lipolytica]|uniref:hypothetical protein n=1 Tax=Aliiglaciecola lipolytica TaxID=477689 RepID=UPI001C0A316A|nr:hypothetical protein [Aliiglaciecola lipolytica]MBU2877672.1 hypothetical protein [Aliiglaciecola lipolytica]
MRINMLFILSFITIAACSPNSSETEQSKNPESLLMEQQKHDQAIELETEKKLLTDSLTEMEQAHRSLDKLAELQMAQSEKDLISLAAEKNKLAEQQLIENAEVEAEKNNALLNHSGKATDDLPN